MLKEKTVAACGPTVSAEGWTRRAASTLLWMMLGVLAPRVQVYGVLAPFGIGLAAALRGPSAVPVYLAVCVGYLLRGNALLLIRYVAAVGIAAGIRWAFSGLKSERADRVLAVAAGSVAAVAAGAAVQLSGTPSWYFAAALLCEGVLASGFALLCGEVDRLLSGARSFTQPLNITRQAAVAAVAAVAVTALADVTFGEMSVGRVLAGAVILLMARSGREYGGGLSGAVFGTALLLCDPQAGAMGLAMAFGGLTAGLCSRANRFASAGVYIITTALVTLGGGEGEVLVRAVYESAVAALLFVLLPTSLNRPIRRLFRAKTEPPVAEGVRRSVAWRLSHAAGAMNAAADTVNEVSRRLAEIGAPDAGTLCREAAADRCRACGRNRDCWDSGFSATMEAFNRLVAGLRAGESPHPAQLPPPLNTCPQGEALVTRIREGYDRFSARETAFRRLADLRAAANEPFFAVASMLNELADTFSDTATADTQAAARVEAVCRQHGLSPAEPLCLLDKSGRMEVWLTLPAARPKVDERAFLRQVGEACGRTFQPPQMAAEGGTRLCLRERPRLRLQVAVAQLPCSAETLCGDAVEQATDPQGHALVVLSDGMGCGGRAAVDGAMAAALTARLLCAGFREPGVLRMVNSALSAKSGDESLATLDVARFDPYTGRLELWKAGAAASLLCRRGRLARLDRASLPLGILREVTFERLSDTLQPGDVVLMFSDGAVSEGAAAAETHLQRFDPQSERLQSLCERVASTARRLQQADGGHEDDITVVALQVREYA